MTKDFPVLVGLMVTAVSVTLLETCVHAMALSTSHQEMNSASSLHNQESSFQQQQTSSLALWVLLCASLNSVSHFKVVSGQLGDAYTVSILLGVGFDVLSTMVYASYWFEFGGLDSRRSINDLSPQLLLMKMVICGGFVFATTLLMIHVRALFYMASSMTCLKSVVTSAWNNVKGDPGPWYLDHLFAYSDWGYHIFHVKYVAQHTQLVHDSFMSAKVVNGLLALTAGVASMFILYCHLERVTREQEQHLGSSRQAPPPASTCTSLLRVAYPNTSQLFNKRNQCAKPICHCPACQGTRAFCLDWQRGQLCTLWFQSFGQLCSIIHTLEQEEHCQW